MRYIVATNIDWLTMALGLFNYLTPLLKKYLQLAKKLVTTYSEVS
jgi:hypothetical protein